MPLTPSLLTLFQVGSSINPPILADFHALHMTILLCLPGSCTAFKSLTLAGATCEATFKSAPSYSVTFLETSLEEHFVASLL